MVMKMVYQKKLDVILSAFCVKATKCGRQRLISADQQPISQLKAKAKRLLDEARTEDVKLRR